MASRGDFSFPINGIQQGTACSGQPALSIECGRAAAGRGGDRLAVAAVDQVAGSEHALRGSPGRTPLGQDVATRIEVDASDQEIRAWRLADSDDDGRDRDGGFAAAALVAYAHPADVLATVYGQDFGRCQDRDVGMTLQTSNGSG